MRTVFTVLIIALVLAACGNRDEQPARDARDLSRTQREIQLPQQPDSQYQVRARWKNTGNKDWEDDTTAVERLEKLAKSVPEVHDATVVVIGNTAIVGIDVDGDLDRSRVGTVKYSVAEALRSDPKGAHAFVTADIDIRNRLREIAEDIRRGQPAAAFANELADIIGRIMLQVPQDIMPRDEHEPMDTEDRRELHKNRL